MINAPAYNKAVLIGQFASNAEAYPGGDHYETLVWVKALRVGPQILVTNALAYRIVVLVTRV